MLKSDCTLPESFQTFDIESRHVTAYPTMNGNGTATFDLHYNAIPVIEVHSQQ